jgi:hypothetical protein
MPPEEPLTIRRKSRRSAAAAAHLHGTAADYHGNRRRKQVCAVARDSGYFEREFIALSPHLSNARSQGKAGNGLHFPHRY